MNSNILNIIKFKKDFFNYKDSTNDLLLYQGLSLQIGYTLKLQDSKILYKNNNKYILPLNHLYRLLQNSPGLNLLGPQKYWASGDEYFFSLKHNQQVLEQLVVLQEPFNQIIEIPFDCRDSLPLEITLKLKKFGGNNLRSWNFYIKSDYDSQALNSLHKLNPNWGFPIILRDIEFLYSLEKTFEKNPPDSWLIPKVIPLLKRYYTHLSYNYLKIEVLKNQKQPLAFKSLADGFKCTTSINVVKVLKIKMILYINLNIILPFKVYGQMLSHNFKFIIGKLWKRNF